MMKTIITTLPMRTTTPPPTASPPLPPSNNNNNSHTNNNNHIGITISTIQNLPQRLPSPPRNTHTRTHLPQHTCKQHIDVFLVFASS
eukprot:m.139104 g.139104  ORF g.139104 m.139104 type:complete len:87 (-) comp30034_c0_seq1:352-612(-)